MTVVRELRVTDIRCHTEGCGVGPGESCRTGALDPCPSRIRELGELAAAGWQWQEVDPTDVVARARRSRL